MIISKSGHHNLLEVSREEAVELIQALSSSLLNGGVRGFPVIRQTETKHFPEAISIIVNTEF